MFTLLIALASPAHAVELHDTQVARGECATLAGAHAGRALMPVSVFHDWDKARNEAAAMAKAWDKEPPGLAWTRLQLAMHVKHKASPTRAARGLALMHVAMRDAALAAQTCGEDVALAQSMAAAHVLGYLFNAEERAFDRIVFELAARHRGHARDKPDEASARALSLGYEVGRQLVAYGDSDGAQHGWNGVRLQWYGEGRYYGPGSWEPTPQYFYFPPSEPFAPLWRTWVPQDLDALRPVPPRYGSPAYLKDLQEVIDVQRALTPEQRAIAEHWVDGHGSVTPPGHWNQIALDALAERPLADARQALDLFADLNMAMADVFIVAWDVKYYYWSVRPVTAAKQLLGVDYKPAILTPPFPGYVSGHAATSGAAGRVLGHYMPDRAARFNAQAEQAAMSRLYGGIHFRHDNEDGLTLGRRIAGAVIERARPHEASVSASAEQAEAQQQGQ
ncbi:vanadium-dependent haloperoxidase [Methyloversatilis thermotolerans]|uniref:vanadium-dependent haloperoxidase n=1 Tax=Methyloversatilis thermotolerans TaxID=1346290 RepID=UPI000374E92D|nr:vanadium-dependent haloperoxidase [Methyloversatilis thermotolerans]